MEQKLYYYCISPNEGLIQKEYEVTFRHDNFNGDVYEKVGWSPMPEPYTYGIKTKEIEKVDNRYLSVCLLEDNPLKAISLLQTTIRKKMYPLQKMFEFLEQEELKIQDKADQIELEEMKKLQNRFNELIDTLETMYTMPEYTYKMLYFLDGLSDRQIWSNFKHRQQDGILPVTISTYLTRKNNNDIYRAVAIYDDSSAEYPIITWHGSLEEFEAIVKQYIPEALEYTEEFNKTLEGIQK